MAKAVMTMSTTTGFTRATAGNSAAGSMGTRSQRAARKLLVHRQEACRALCNRGPRTAWPDTAKAAETVKQSRPGSWVGS